jgi:hypothetical protein
LRRRSTAQSGQERNSGVGSGIASRLTFPDSTWTSISRLGSFIQHRHCQPGCPRHSELIRSVARIHQQVEINDGNEMPLRMVSLP